MIDLNADPNELAVVGAALLDPNSIRFALNHVEPADFHNLTLSHLYTLLIGMRSAGYPIDAVTVFDRLREEGDPILRRVDGVDLSNLREATPTASNVEWYAKRVAAAAARRRYVRYGLRIAQLAEGDMPIDELATIVRDEYTAVTTNSGGDKWTRRTLADVLAEEDTPEDWVIPGLLERGDRLMLTGGEGAGKTTLMRQIVIATAAGINPITFDPIDPIQSVVIDVENSERQWRRQTRGLALKARHRSHLAIDPLENIGLYCRGRIDITSQHTLAHIHAALDEHEPGIVVIGPIYKLIPGSMNDEDQAARVITALDSIRDRGIAMVIEAHAGHSKINGGDRDLRPRGSSQQLGWPEFGFGLQMDAHDPTLTHVIRWRGDRDDTRTWPDELRRGGDWPWTDGRQPTTRPDSPYYGEPR